MTDTAMAPDWQRVWNGRGGVDAGDAPNLQRLLEIDGYDTGAGRLDAGDFRPYVRELANRLGLEPGRSVYEVGCGAGALLLALSEEAGARVAGCDYAASLVALARRRWPEGDFTVAEAAAFVPAARCDVVLSRSVFQYFRDLDYAARVLDRMIDAATTAVAVLEVPNMATREEAERARRDLMTPSVYAARYKGLEHLYYSPEWFDRLAGNRGWTCESSGHAIAAFAQSRYRFDVLMRPPQQVATP